MSDDLIRDGILCWFCPVCHTMMTVEQATRHDYDYCCRIPRYRDCPLPLRW